MVLVLRGGSRLLRSLWSSPASSIVREGTGQALERKFLGTQRAIVSSARKRWMATNLAVKEDEEEEEEKKPTRLHHKRSGFHFDLVGEELASQPIMSRPMAPHVTHMKAQFNTMLSISSRIGAVWLTMLLFLPTPGFWNAVVEHVPIGHLNAMGIFTLISLFIHSLFTYQNKYVLWTKWGSKGTSWKKYH